MPTAFRRPDTAVGVALFVAASAIAFAVILPIRSGQVGFDGAASVLYFDRLVAGRQLEAFLTSTPKPLLTIVYGIIHSLTHDWRPVTWSAITAFGVAVVMAAALARRLGGLTSGAFAAVAFIGSTSLLQDVALSYALVWALVGWLVAGLAVTSERPRYGIAGIALAIATLARFETLIVVALALVILAGLQAAAAVGRAAAPPRGSWLLMLGFVALPIQFAHDWLLTGDPLFSELVPVAASVGAPLRSPLGVVQWLVQHYLGMGPLVFLAIIGVVTLARRRRWSILAGLTALGPGVGLFLVYLAYRQIYVSNRYSAPIDLAIVFAAAIGSGVLRIPEFEALDLVGRSVGRVRTTAIVVVAGLAGMLFAAPFAPLSSTVVSTARDNLALHENADAAIPTIEAALAKIPGAHDWPASSNSRPGGSTGTRILLAPVLLGPQLAVDLDLPLDKVAGIDGPKLTTSGAYPSPGQLIYHDRRGDLPPEAFALLETDVPVTTGAISIDPLRADPGHGWWVLLIGAAR